MSKNLFSSFMKNNDDLNNFISQKDDLFYFTENTYFEILKRPNSLKKIYFREDTLANEEIKELKKRIFYSLKSHLHDPIPTNLFQELFLYLKTNPEVQIEYLGRNLHDKHYSHDIKKVKNHTFAFDVLNGKRKYYWKIHINNNHFIEKNFKENFPHLKEWFFDPEARVVLSLGGGGLRSHAIPSILKIIDFLDVREHIDELWGCSGGAMIGGYYSYGVPPLFIENICYDFYNERHEDFVLKGSIFKTLKTFIKESEGKNLNEFIGMVKLQKILQRAFNHKISEAHQNKSSQLKEIPFFALVSTPFQKEMIALTEERYISSKCTSFLKPAQPFESISASSSIPLIMEPIIKNYSDGKYYFFDGALSEEIPLTLPLKKFNLEKNESNKKKLKIFYVNLNSRLRESKTISNFFSKQSLTFIYKHLLLIDKSLDQKIEKSISSLQSNPDVEIIGLDLVLNKNAFLDTKEIPYIIRNGRDHFLEEIFKLEKDLALNS